MLQVLIIRIIPYAVYHRVANAAGEHPTISERHNQHVTPDMCYKIVKGLRSGTCKGPTL